MLIREGHLQDIDQNNCFCNERYEIRWLGFVYMNGCPSGLESIKCFAEKANTGIARIAADLKGVYFVAVKDRAEGASYAFVDTGGLYHAFHSQGLIGTSFLEIAQHEGLAWKDVDSGAVVEFFQFGALYEGRTFFTRIRKIEPDSVVVLRPHAQVQFVKKSVPDLDDRPQHSFEHFLQEFLTSVRTENVSLDLTGGIDTRLLAVAFTYFGFPCEFAASGIPGNTDIRIAEQVAEILGRPLYVTHHNPGDTDWGHLFALCDGMFDLAKADRPVQLQRSRVRRGMSLAVSGAGGEILKDFFWLQDFPFYRRKRPNLKRLLSVRIAPIAPSHSMLAEPYRSLSKRYCQALEGSLNNYCVAGNTQSYDRIYYLFKMRGFAGRFLTNSTPIIQVYAPYLDHEAVRFGYGLSRSSRFFNRFHRGFITSLSPRAARIPTTEGGITVSSKPAAIASDLYKYALDRGIRVARKCGQKVLNRTYGQESSDSDDLPSVLRSMSGERRTIERLKDCGVLSPGLKSTEVDPSYLGRLLCLDMLIEKLDSRVMRSSRGALRVA